jgi:hypothetical protein
MAADRVVLDDVLARLGRLEDERAIMATLHRYGHDLDYGREATWLACFAEDGILDIRSRVAGTRRVAAGRAELAAFFAWHSHAPERFHKHLLAETMLSLDGDRATAESLYVRLDAASDGVPYVFSFGRYRDRLRRLGDGTWCFEERIAESEALSDRDR